MGSFSSFFNVDVCKCFGLILRKSITKTRTFSLVSLFFYIFNTNQPLGFNMQIFIPNWFIRIWSWCVLYTQSVHGNIVMVHSLYAIGSRGHAHGALRMQPHALRLLPPWRLVFLEQGGERSELPCPSLGGGELGRRPWPFYVKCKGTAVCGIASAMV